MQSCSRSASYPYQNHFVPTSPGELERFPLVASCEALPPELKRCLPPAKVYLDMTFNHLYVLFEESFRYHYAQLLHHLISVKAMISHSFGSEVPLAVGLLGSHGYTFGVAEFEVQTSLRPSPKTHVASPTLTIADARHLKGGSPESTCQRAALRAVTRV